MNPGPRLKVLQVGKFYAPHRGGIETHLQLLCEGLAPHADVEVVVSNERARSERARMNGVSVLRCARWLSLSSAPISPAMLGVFRSTDADIVHLHLPNPPALLAYLASGNSAPLVLTYHSDTVRQKILGPIFLPFLKRGIERSAAVIATSREYAATSPVLSRYQDRCRIIPMAIAWQEFERADVEQIQRIRALYGPRIILSIGRLVYYKGFEHLIAAMSQVEGRLLIMGNGPLRRPLERLARRIAVADKIVFLGEIGSQAELVAHYRACDVFALASVERSEAFGIVQLEAMACGVPVVNTRIASGVPFVSPDGVTGLTVPPGNPEALAVALNRLLDDPPLRRAFGSAGRQRVEEIFGQERMVQDTLRVYSEAIGRKIRESA